MDKDPVMYQLMALRVKTIMKNIVGTDENYQILRKSNKYSNRPDAMKVATDFSCFNLFL